MLLYSYACGPVAANMMFVGRDGAKTVAVIDPSDADLALTVLKEHGWTLSDILITHRHFDHLLGVAALILIFVSRRLFRPLEEAEHRQQAFISEMEKDFQIPLTVLNADAELIEKEHGSSDATVSIRRQVESMTGLLRRLDSLSLVEFGEEAEAFSLSELLLREAERAKRGIEEKGIDRQTGRVIVEVSPDFYRPTDVVNLWGDPTKAKEKLGWNPQSTSFEQLVSIMVKHDMEKVAADHVAAVMRTNLAEYLEKGLVK